MIFQVSRAAVEGYNGEGEPPCIVMTLRATNKTVSIDDNFTVTLDGLQPPNTITITRSPDAANFQAGASTDDDDDRLSTFYGDIGKLYIWYMKTMKLPMHLLLMLHTEWKAVKGSDMEYGLVLPIHLYIDYIN